LRNEGFMTLPTVDFQLAETAKLMLKEFGQDASARTSRAIEDLKAHEQAGGTRILSNNEFLEDYWTVSQPYEYAKYGIKLIYNVFGNTISVCYIYIEPPPSGGASPNSLRMPAEIFSSTSAASTIHLPEAEVSARHLVWVQPPTAKACRKLSGQGLVRSAPQLPIFFDAVRFVDIDLDRGQKSFAVNSSYWDNKVGDFATAGRYVYVLGPDFNIIGVEFDIIGRDRDPGQDAFAVDSSWWDVNVEDFATTGHDWIYCDTLVTKTNGCGLHNAADCWPQQLAVPKDLYALVPGFTAVTSAAAGSAAVVIAAELIEDEYDFDPAATSHGYSWNKLGRAALDAASVALAVH
jgi:hypothetical protein